MTERRPLAGRVAGGPPARFGDDSRPAAGDPAGWQPALLFFLLIACAAGAPKPIEIDTKADTCHYCRMTISTPRFALQVHDPGEEPRLFDDIGCALHELRGTAKKDRTIFVADWKTGAWMRVEDAVLERCTHADTPMASHLVAMKAPSGDTRCTPVAWKDLVR